jgi:RNA polymerase sigma-70 factor (ECF subfamily)
MSRYGDEIYEYCRKKLGDRALAADIRQRVFIEAYRDLLTFRGRSSLRTWLFGIARHRVLDAAKKRRREVSYLSPKNMAVVPSLEVTPEVRLDEARLCDAVVKCLKATTKRRVQQTVLLRFHAGLSYEDMAEILHERPNTLRVRIRRTLQLLRRNVAFTS